MRAARFELLSSLKRSLEPSTKAHDLLRRSADQSVSFFCTS